MQLQTFAVVELLYTEAAVEVSEGGVGAMICMRLGGTGWLTLERELTVNLDSDGGKQQVREKPPHQKTIL